MLATVLFALPVMGLLTLLQTAVLPRIAPFEVLPSFPFIVALAWSLVSSLEEGIVWAFIGGLFMDIFTIAPVGGLSLTYVIAVLAVGLLTDFLPSNRVLVPMLMAAIATVIQQVLYMLYLALFGISASMTLTSLAELVIAQAVLILPVHWLFYVIRRALKPRPVQI